MTHTTLRHPLLPLAAILMAAAALTACSGHKTPPDPQTHYTKYERNLLKQGTAHYRDSDFAAAETAYDKVLACNPHNSHARYNAALTTLRRASRAAEGQQADRTAATADSVFSTLYTSTAVDTLLRADARYNQGNIAYNAADYARSIEMYKSLLRADPSNTPALENLRLAQLKLQQQQDQQQNQDQNQDNKDQDQQQNQDQNKDNKDQQQDQQDQNKDQDKQGQNKPRPEDQDKQPQDQTSGMSSANARQILEAMEKKEAATRQRVEGMKADQERRAAGRPQTAKPW